MPVQSRQSYNSLLYAHRNLMPDNSDSAKSPPDQVAACRLAAPSSSLLLYQLAFSVLNIFPLCNPFLCFFTTFFLFLCKFCATATKLFSLTSLPSNSMMNYHVKIQKGINIKMDYLQKLTLHRRELHKIPELSGSLPKTKAYIKSVLEALDCQVFDVLESGIYAYFDRGKERTTAYRADMDALPVKEINTHDYVSTHEGNMHACGHDGHSAMVLTLAEYVNQQRELPCNVLCIFQPAEETTGGAKDICNTGILEKYRVDRIYGVHLWPFMEAGKIASKPGPMMPRSSEITIEVTGRSSHATAPENGIDALFIACRYVQEIYDSHKARMRPNPAPEQRTIIQICKMVSGTARNVISGHSFLLGTVRAFSDEDFAGLVKILEETADRLSREYNCQITARHTEGYPPVVNDVQLYARILPALKENLDYEEMEIPAMISEDYSFYGLHVPSVFFFLGTGTGISLHSNNFDFDETVLMHGLELYETLLFQ